ncbi:MAG TPA: biotin synthase BioB [Dehalococcoidia bacterium]|nr:biotin synthase BioB [Dehalococcoidia bacterium]
MDWMMLGTRALAGAPPTREESLAVLGADDTATPAIVAAAHVVRHRYFGKTVKVNFLVNIKSGICPEDCHYCSQSRLSDAPIDRYGLLSADEIVTAARRGRRYGARRICLVASGRGPSDADIAHIERAVRDVRAGLPDAEICACLGLLDAAQAARLRDAGVFAYNHNLNTSEAFYGSICGTHGYDDRVATVRVAQASGLSPCSGALFGMGESDEDIVEVAGALRSLGADSVPVNFLIPIAGTPLGGTWSLTPMRCLRILSLMRLTMPASELRIAGGREHHLRSLQAMGLLVANSIFIGDYLTAKGQRPEDDIAMIRDLGFEILGDGAEWNAGGHRGDDVALKSARERLGPAD